jgi:hypothetical protein
MQIIGSASELTAQSVVEVVVPDIEIAVGFRITWIGRFSWLCRSEGRHRLRVCH